MFLFLTALSPRGLGQRWHGQVATRSIPVARAPPHLSTAGCWQLPRALNPGTECPHGLGASEGPCAEWGHAGWAGGWLGVGTATLRAPESP